MLNPEANPSAWQLGIFLMLTCIAAGGVLAIPTDSGRTAVSEAYSHNDSSTTLYSSDNYLKCTFEQQVTVTSTEDIRDLLHFYNSRKQPVRIRATRRGFHSSAGFVCAGTRGSSYAEYRKVDIASDQVPSVMVLLHLLNRVVSVDKEHQQLTVEAGMTLWELTRAAKANDMSIPLGALSLYSNLTVGGVILTSAHGSGYRTSSSLGDLVRKVKWVNARAEVIESDVQTEQGAKEVRALVGGLGLLGIVTEVTLQLQPNSWTIVEARKYLEDTHMVGELKKLLEEETPNVVIVWRPDLGRYAAYLWTQVEEKNYDAASMPTFYPKGTIAWFSAIDEQTANATKELMAAWESDVRDESPSADVLNSGVCSFSLSSVNTSIFQDGYGTLVDRATVPTSNAQLSKDCAPKCIWNVQYSGTFIEDAEFTIKLSDLEDWVNDVKRVVRTDLAEADARLSARYGEGKVKRCMSPGYFVLRVGQGNQNLLSTSTGSHDVVYVQFSNYHSALIPNELSKVSTIVETIEQLTLCKYKGRPHWGKNHERVNSHPKCKVRDNFPAANIAELLEMQQLHDPRKVFEPELFKHVLQRKGPKYSPLCTPHYWCYCAADWHCPPGFHCGGSPSFAEYKICKLG